MVRIQLISLLSQAYFATPMNPPCGLNLGPWQCLCLAGGCDEEGYRPVVQQGAWTEPGNSLHGFVHVCMEHGEFAWTKGVLTCSCCCPSADFRRPTAAAIFRGHYGTSPEAQTRNHDGDAVWRAGKSNFSTDVGENKRLGAKEVWAQYQAARFACVDGTNVLLLSITLARLKMGASPTHRNR